MRLSIVREVIETRERERPVSIQQEGISVWLHRLFLVTIVVNLTSPLPVIGINPLTIRNRVATSKINRSIWLESTTQLYV